jgi:dolichyl-phosphate beta-glucosyltransferase
MSVPELSVVIPAFNESKRLAASLTAISRFLDDRIIAGEVLVVDDGSTDDTAEVARRLIDARRGAVIGGAPNRGKGFAVRQGVRAARGLRILVTDADLSCPIDQYDVLEAARVAGGLDVAMGSRDVPGSRVDVRQHPGREHMGRAFNVLVRLATGLPFRDTQCGFKLLDAARVKPLLPGLRVNGFAYDVELLLACARQGLRMAEVPVVWRNSPDSHVSLIADPIRMLIDLARVSWAGRGRR